MIAEHYSGKLIIVEIKELPSPRKTHLFRVHTHKHTPLTYPHTHPSYPLIVRCTSVHLTIVLSVA